MSAEQARPSNTEPADAWDAVADERERLADERERLADTREHLANERERLADEQERLLDERRDAAAFERDATGDHDETTARAEAEAELARADARVERAIAERERAKIALERRLDAEQRSHANGLRESALHAASDLSDDDLRWAQERRSFVASERHDIAQTRDELQEVRDELADRRERLADERDVADHAREHTEDARGANQLRTTAGGARSRSVRAHADLEEVREAARRQRRAAVLGREHDRASRADTEQSGGSTFVPTIYGPGLTEQFAALTRELFASRDLTTISRRVIEFAVQCVPNCVAAGFVLLPGVAPMLHVTTDAVAQRLDALQVSTGKGPIAEALGSPEPVSVAEFAAQSRWRDIAQVAAELDVGSMVAYGLAVPRDGRWQPLGTLTLYAEAPDAFDADVRDLGGILSCYLSVAAALERDRTDLSRREAALHRALGTRDVIGQAKGILMERRHLSAGEAFDTLRTTSQRLNIAVHDLAARLAETGELPE